MAQTYRQLVLNVARSGKMKQFVVQKNGKFTIGQRGDNDLTLLGRNFPRKYALFSQKNGTYLLNIRSFVDGNISLDDSTLRIRDLIQNDLLPRNGEDLVLKLTQAKNGIVTVGDARIEFEFKQVQAKPKVVYNISAFSWRRAVLKGLTSDLLFKSIFLILLILNSLMLYALKDYEVHLDTKLDLERIPERLAQFIIKPPEELFESDIKTLNSTKGEVEQGQKTEEKPETQKRTNNNRSNNRTNASGPKRGNPAASAGLLGLIAGTGESGKSSTIVDALVDKGLVADLNSIVGAGTNLKVSKDGNKDEIDPLDQLIGTGGSGGIDDFLSALEDDVPQVTLTKKAKVDLIKPSKMTGSQEALGKRSEQSVMNVVLARQGRITYLYEKYLKRNPNLRGKISIEFTIAANGFVTSAQVIESTINHPDLERDLLNLVKRLKFDPIPTGNVTTVFPFQFSKVN